MVINCSNYMCEVKIDINYLHVSGKLNCDFATIKFECIITIN